MRIYGFGQQYEREERKLEDSLVGANQDPFGRLRGKEVLVRVDDSPMLGTYMGMTLIGYVDLKM